MEQIAVLIASSNEYFLKQTIDSCLSAADEPDRIHFCIARVTYGDFVNADISSIPNIRLIDIKSDTIIGPGPTRFFSEKLISNEDEYCLQIDAHTIFQKSWDTNLVNYYNKISHDNDKIAITARSKSWFIDKNDKVFLVNPGQESIQIDPLSFDIADDDTLFKLKFNSQKSEGYPTIVGVMSETKGEYVEHNLISAGMLFAKKDFFINFPSDPQILWGGDEGILALRAWCEGYKFYTINKTILLTMDKGRTSTRYIDQDWRVFAEQDKSYKNRQRSGVNFIKKAFTGEYFGRFGAKNRECLDQFAQACNINFEQFYAKNI